MDEFRQHAGWCPRGQRPGLYRLDLKPDYGAFPVWEAYAGIDGMSSPQRIEISPDLADGLSAWGEWADRHSEYGGGEAATAHERENWLRQGQALADELAQQTGAEVVYLWPFGPGGDSPDCPRCGGRRLED